MFQIPNFVVVNWTAETIASAICECWGRGFVFGCMVRPGENPIMTRMINEQGDLEEMQ